MDSNRPIRQKLITFDLKYHFNMIFLFTLQQILTVYVKYTMVREKLIFCALLV